MASGVTGLVILAASACANLYINRVGRRTLLISGGLCIASAHYIIGSMYTAGVKSVAAQYVVVLAVEWFALSNTATWYTFCSLAVYTWR